MSTPPRRPIREGLRDTPARREHTAHQLLFETASEDLLQQLNLGEITPPPTSPQVMAEEEGDIGREEEAAAAAAPAQPIKKDPLDFNTSIVAEKLVTWAADPRNSKTVKTRD